MESSASFGIHLKYWRKCVYGDKGAPCRHCNGYYGPNFGEPLCATCHAFLSLPKEEEKASRKTDEYDSGNEGDLDEPTLRMNKSLDIPREPSGAASIHSNAFGVDIDDDPLGDSAQNGLFQSSDGVNGMSLIRRPGILLRIFDYLDDLSKWNASKVCRRWAWLLGSSHPAETYDEFIRSRAKMIDATRCDSGEAAAKNPRGNNCKSRNGVLENGGWVRIEIPPDDEMYYAEPVAPSSKSCRPKQQIQGPELAERLCPLSTREPMEQGQLLDVSLLPPEVLLAIFAHLDDFSLWNTTNVCKRWEQIIKDNIQDEMWEEFLANRWPLFVPAFSLSLPQAGWLVYSKLVDSAPCKECLHDMTKLKQLPCDRILGKNRLWTEMRALRADLPEGIEAKPLDGSLMHWQATITGPRESPYEGGIFFLYLMIPTLYPMKPPVLRFLTKIFHPNVSRHGDVGLDLLGHNWTSSCTIPKLLVSVQSFITDPYCKICMEPEIGRLYETDPEEFRRIAVQWTWRYAMNDYLIP